MNNYYKNMKSAKRIVSVFTTCLLLTIFSVMEAHAQATNAAPLRLAVAGIKHVHVP